MALTKKARVLEDTPASTLAQARARADAWRRLEEDPDLAQRKLAADAWCAAFVQPKSPDHGQGITHDTIQQIVENPGSVPTAVLATVREMAQQYRFFHWHLEFPGIFTVPGSDTAEVDPSTGWQGGFSCVVGNPPWERVKIQDKEFFSAVGRNDIADAKTAAIRSQDDRRTQAPRILPRCMTRTDAALRSSDGTSHLLVHSGRYPLTGQGDINTYSVFAETFRTITAPAGTAGVISPTGLATDKTTAPFFADTLSSSRLVAFYDFENEAKIFPGVHHALPVRSDRDGRYSDGQSARTRFAFLTRHVADVARPQIRTRGRGGTRTKPKHGHASACSGPRADADITLGIYQRHPILIRDGHGRRQSLGLVVRKALRYGERLWAVPATRRPNSRANFNGWSYDGETEYVPLYEAKMLGHFDHRFSTYRMLPSPTKRWLTTPTPIQQHDDPNMESLARYWVARAKVS